MKDCVLTPADEVGRQKQKPKHSSDLFLNHCSCSKTSEKCRYQKKTPPSLPRPNFDKPTFLGQQTLLLESEKTKHCFWLVVEPTPLKNMIVKLGPSSPNFRGENLKNSSKPPPSMFCRCPNLHDNFNKNPYGMEWNGKPKKT